MVAYREAMPPDIDAPDFAAEGRGAPAMPRFRGPWSAPSSGFHGQRRLSRIVRRVVAVARRLRSGAPSAPRAATEAFQANESIRHRFFADVSHELRSPLTAIVGEAEVALRLAGTDPHAYRAALNAILSNATYLNRRIEDLMAFARSVDGHLELRPATIDLNSVAAATTAQINGYARLNEIVVEATMPTTPTLVRGDAEKLRQSLAILLDNAVKFSRPRQVVALAVESGRGRASLRVTDHGIGIAPPDLPRIFDRFYQATAGHRAGGSGLGLSIARRIVEAHDGEIVASSDDRAGTIFTMSLPLARDGGP